MFQKKQVFFVQSKEEESNNLSSKSKYKGRGILQITGIDDGTGFYNLPGPYKNYGKAKYADENKFLNSNADLISTNLHHTVDVGGWIFNYKEVPLWELNPKKTYSQELKETIAWKRSYFSKGLGKNLNQLGLLMEQEEEKYFFLQGKILNGYSLSHRLERPPNGWAGRKKALQKLKAWFKYDKNVCNGEEVVLPNLEGRAPWFKIAWQEYEKYKGLREIDSPLKEQVHEYFKVSSTGSKKENGNLWDHTDPWCGAFLGWCFDQTENYKRINTAYSAQAFGWKSDKWTNGENSEAFVGALIIFDFSHVALIAGENKDGSGYVYLGGNQGNGEKRAGYQKIILGSVSKNSASILGITKPKKYVISEEDKQLPKYDVNAENSKESSR